MCECGGDAGQLDAGPPDASVPDASLPPDAMPRYRRLYLLGDSVPINGASDVAHRAASLIAASYPGTTVNACVGGRSLFDVAGDPAKRAATLALIVHPDLTDLVVEDEANDYMKAQWTHTAYRDGYAALVDGLHASMPSVRVYCVVNHVQGNGLNAVGSSLNMYSQAVRDACAGRGTVVEAGTFGIVSVDKYDAWHLKDSGHAKWAAGVRAVVGW